MADAESMTEEDLEMAVIGTIGSMDSPMSYQVRRRRLRLCFFGIDRFFGVSLFCLFCLLGVLLGSEQRRANRRICLSVFCFCPACCVCLFN